MLRIEPHNLHWLEGTPPEQDLCAHGGFVLRQGDTVVVDQRDGNWTLSAAALYLLRTLTSDHTPDASVGDQLFPCCGHAMFAREGSPDVLILGCPNGYDFEVLHRGDEVQLGFEDGRQLTVARAEWGRAVVEFADRLESFYADGATKEPKVDAEGFAVFLAEWQRRREEARCFG